MKPLVLFLGLLLLVNCGQDAKHPAGPVQPGGPAGSTRIAVFADTSLEAAVRIALSQPTAPLTLENLLSLQQLSASGRGIADLRGIEHLDSLTALDLSDNRITDISPLAHLTRLKFLDLTNNQVQDLSPLAGLQSLESLVLDYNPIRDLGPLLGLEKLHRLELLGTPLSRIAQDTQVPALQARGVIIEAQVDTTQQVPGMPDNRTRIAFQSNREGDFHFYTIRPDGSDLRKMGDYTVNPNDRVSVSPRQDRVAFSMMSDTSGFDIYIADLDGSNQRNLTRDLPELSRRNGYPSWSPEGDRLVFLSSGRLNAYGFWMINVDGSNLHRVVQDTELEVKMSYLESFSPQWNKIAFLSGEGAKPGTRALYTSDIDGTNWTLVLDAAVNARGSDYEPTYISCSPDGQKIAFVSNRDGNRELYVVNVDGSGLTRVTHDDSYDVNPVWSPDGRWLAFDTDREGQWEVFVVDVEGNNTYNLTNSFTYDSVCSWLAGQ